VDDYLGRYDYAGKRALEVGTASGYLTFEMEKRGASVVSFDMGAGSQWNIVPFVAPQFDGEQLRENCVRGRDRLVNGYWLAHRLLGSSAQAFYGSVEDLPEALGPFDVVLLGMILPDLRDPFAALASAARLAAETVIITQQRYVSEDPAMRFMPDPETLRPDRAWWLMSESLVERMLNVLGFDLETTIHQKHRCLVPSKLVPCTTYVARRRG
jgi:hypothetical protein